MNFILYPGIRRRTNSASIGVDAINVKEDDMPAHSLPKHALPTQDEFGLTMRDYFAAAALNALLSKVPTGPKDEAPARYAEIAYAYADAMLVARSSGLI